MSLLKHPFPTPAREHQHALVTLLGLLLLSALVFALWDVMNLDNAVSSYWGNKSGFALKEHAFWGYAIYYIQRLIGWACMAVLLWIVFKPPAFAPVFQIMPRHRRWFMLAGVIVALLVIQLLKRRSLTSCPWEYQMFGGIAQDISHWRFGVKDGGPGHCFPAGHPSAGFAFFAVPVFLLLSAPRLAAQLAIAALGLGAMLGLTQIARGAHFVSHVLWSAWWCAAAACALLALCLALERYQARAPAAG